MKRCFWLDAPNARVMIGAWAVLIGRSPDCNIVLEEPEISRHHLLVRVGQEGVEMLPLGREPVRLNGVECRALTALRAGDRIEIDRWTFRLGEGELADDSPGGGTAWCIELPSGPLHHVVGPIFRVGGGARDDLSIGDWEPTVCSFSPRSGGLTLTALRPGVWCGRALVVGEPLDLAPDALITYRASSLHVRARPAHLDAATRESARPQHAVVAVLEFLPRGGKLTVEVGGLLLTMPLSDRRCDLIASLLQPPPPFAAGEFIPEEVLCARVWPGESKGRIDLNSLLYRLRQNLTDEGIDPAPLLERRGGALRFCLAPRARVVVR